MKPYLFSLGAGLLVGIIYYLLGQRSPAPPVVALVGLFGILIGEQVIPLSKRLLVHFDVVQQADRPGMKSGSDVLEPD